MALYYNTTEYPVVIDADSRSVGGKEHVECAETPEIAQAVAVGSLIVVATPTAKKTSKAQAAPAPVVAEDK